MNKVIVFLFALILWISKDVLAGETVYSRSVWGADLESASALDLEEEFYGVTSGLSNVEVQDRVVLKYTGQDNFKWGSSWSLSCTFKIRVFDASGTDLTQLLSSHPDYVSEGPYTLNIGYDDLANYDDIDVLSFEKGHRIELYDVSTSTSLLSVPSDVYLDMEIEVERYHDYDRTDVPILGYRTIDNTTYSSANDREVEVYWSFVEGAEEYDLEWIFIPEEYYNGALVLPSEEYARISTSNQRHLFHLPYDDGDVYFRVRAVGRYGPNMEFKKAGNWTSLDQTGNPVKVAVLNKDADKNWVYSRTFTEEGKTKEVLSYSDGSGRGRQTVTRLNTDSHVLLSETYYDYEGRAVIQSLPAPDPLRSGELRFYDNFNKGIDPLTPGSPFLFSKEYYDNDGSGGCTYPDIAMDPLTGASNYYSASNADQEGFNAYIADAEYYPFTRTIYGLDGSVRLQSGVGEAHKIDEGTADSHETQTFYGRPSQEKLDRLFGSDAGLAKHYRVNGVKDANGQVALSYVNLSGQTVATSLVGDEPDNLDALSSVNTSANNAGSGTGGFTEELINFNQYEASSNCMKLTHSKLIEATGNHTFSYTLEPEEFMGLCDYDPQSAYDFICEYDLIITIYSNCMEAIYEQGASAGSPDILHVAHANVNASSLTPVVLNFTVDFQEIGTYWIEKELCLNQDALNAHLEEYEDYLRTEETSCIDEISDITDAISANTDVEGCLSCIEYHEAHPEEIPGYISGMSSGEITYLATELCGEIGLPTDANCSALLDIFTLDLSPGGQYFDNIVDINSGSYDENDWLDNNSSVSPSTLSGGTYSTWADIRANWDPSWASTLVVDHPEYCHYTWCVSTEDAYLYASELATITTYSGTKTDILTNDPDYNTSSYFTSSNSSLLTYATYSSGTGSIEDVLSDYLGYNPGSGSGCTGSDLWAYAECIASNFATSPSNDEIWEQYKQLYTAEKFRLIELSKDIDGCYYLCDAEAFPVSFPDNIADNCGNTPSNAIGFSIRIPGPDEGMLEAFDPTDIGDFGSNTSSTYEDGAEDIQCFATVKFHASVTQSCDSIIYYVGPAISGYIDYDSDAETLAAAIVSSINALGDPEFTATVVDDEYVQLLVKEEGNCARYLTVQLFSGGSQVDFYKIVDIHCSCECLSELTIEALSSDDYCDGGSGGSSVTVKVEIDNTTTATISNSVSFTCSSGYTATEMADEIATAINAYTSTPNFTAQVLGSTVIITSEDSNGDYANKTMYMSNGTDFYYTLGEIGNTCFQQECICTELEQAYAVNKVLRESNGETYVTGTPGTDEFNDDDLHDDIADAYNGLYGTSVTSTNIDTWLGNCLNKGYSSGSASTPSPLPTEILEGICDPDIDPCDQESSESDALIGFYANFEYENQISEQLDLFTEAYIRHCFNLDDDSQNAFAESFTVTSLDYEYHFTLFYYDRAGNLIKTVPPEGVHFASIANTQAHRDDPGSNSYAFTYHTYETVYEYNSLNQLTRQETPDAGETKFWYDALSRIVASKDARQALSDECSYMVYDGIGRVIESGVIEAYLDPTASDIANANWPTNFATSSSRTDVTRTVYDAPLSGHTPFTSEELLYQRSRVSTAYWYESLLHNYSDINNYVFASHYSYDEHGHVDVLVNENTFLDAIGQSLKRTEYSYDLISGNVKEVSYQPGELDQFTHRYYYDADNRIIEAYTSKDGVIWDQDVRYLYYDHGPLARVEIGDKKVQGSDYVYTIHGWLRGVNSNILSMSNDPGEDAKASSTYSSSVSNIHANIASDAYGFTLSYYDGDYTSIAGSTGFLGDLSTLTASGGFPSTLNKDLYNGNIRSMATHMMDLQETPIDVIANFYTYDQLNRIKSANSYITDHTSDGYLYASASNNLDYMTSYSFDANGNLSHLKRNGYSGNVGGLEMDDFEYYYYDQGGNAFNIGTTPVAPPTNKLAYIDENSGTSIDGNYSEDIDHQGAINYTYDAKGQLTGDVSEEIADIEWYQNGKVKAIKRSSGSTKDELAFYYDGMGNRVIKLVKPRPTGSLSTQEDWEYTIYSRDAQGNVLATYKRSFEEVSANNYKEHLALQEHTLYGSDRLGVLNIAEDIEVVPFTSSAFNSDKTFNSPSYGTPETITEEDLGFNTRELGNKQYENKNHLGNVLTVITDRKVAVLQTGSITEIAYYTPDVVSYSDYYPYGMLMPNRNGTASTYRYGFQGQEKDNEIKGEGNSINYKYRMHDPRLGRFFAVDPLTAKYPYYSPYSFSGNRVLDAVELEGLEPAWHGSKDKQYAIAEDNESHKQYGWIWNNNDGSWSRGSLMEFSDGRNIENDPDNDLSQYATKGGESPDISFYYHIGGESGAYQDYYMSFFLGTSTQSTSEDRMLFDNFVYGCGDNLCFGTHSDMSSIIGDVGSFQEFAQSFEKSAVEYFRKNGNLEGFNGDKIVKQKRPGYLGNINNKFAWTVMGGYQRIEAKIGHISGDEISVEYRIYDHFGAGTTDAWSYLPGLSAMYYLQHYHGNESQYTPFIWSVKIQRDECH